MNEAEGSLTLPLPIVIGYCVVLVLMAGFIIWGFYELIF